ncbi:hypothetical protein D3C77_619220 [compost metagenome]
MNGATRAFNGKVGQVFCRAKTTRYDQCVEVFGIGFSQVLDFATGDARGLQQDIARLGHFFAGQMIDYVHLGNVRSKALHLCAALVQAQQSNHTFVDFGTVIHTTAGKNHCNFFCHSHYSRVEALNVL